HPSASSHQVNLNYISSPPPLLPPRSKPVAYQSTAMSRLANFILLSSFLASAARAASPDSGKSSLLHPLNKLHGDELNNIIRRQDTANATATASTSSDSP